MQLVLIAAGAIGLVVGSVAAAALLCWVLWCVFRFVLHPEWGAIAILALMVLALLGDLPKSQFVDMTLTFAVVAAVPLWFAGRAWRQLRKQALSSDHGQTAEFWSSKPIEPTETLPSPRLYPALTACIGEERSPTRNEVHVVASRLWREGFAQRFGSSTAPASFAARRVLLRAALGALQGASMRSQGSAR